jgi:hypothetical protein
MSEIKVLDVALDDGEMTSTVYTVELEGATYKVDVWSTHNSSGTEFYDQDHMPLRGDDTPDELIEWEHDEDPRITEFWERYHREVEPLMDRIKREAFGTVEEAVTE